MRHSILKTLLFGSTSLFLVSCDKDDDNYDYTPPGNDQAIISQSAGDSASIITTVNQFRVEAGNPINNSPVATGGRREITWDGTADNSPADFFNPTDSAAPAGRKRGLVYFPVSSLLRTSLTGFSEIDSTYGNQFQAFSKSRVFNPDGTNISELRFKVPGTNTDAFIKSFGIVFCDVDDANATTVEIFNGNKSLGIAKAKPSDGKFSFVGMRVQQEKITRIRIISGNAVLAAGVKDVSDGGSKDLVVIDDMIYNEPVALQ